MQQRLRTGISLHDRGEILEVRHRRRAPYNRYLNVVHAKIPYEAVFIGNGVAVIRERDVDDSFEARVANLLKLCLAGLTGAREAIRVLAKVNDVADRLRHCQRRAQRKQEQDDAGFVIHSTLSA